MPERAGNGDSLPKDPPPNAPVPDDPLPGKRRSRRPVIRRSTPSAAVGPPVTRGRVRRVLAAAFRVFWIGVAVPAFILSPLLISAAGVALLLWSSETFEASRGTVVITSCRYEETPADSGPPLVSSSCTGRFVADDGRRIIERATYVAEERIGTGDRVTAWVTDQDPDRAASHLTYSIDFGMAVVFCVLGGLVLVPFGIYLFYEMVRPRRQDRRRLPAAAPAGSAIPGVSLGGEQVHRLDRAEARRIAVRAQLLDSPRPADLLTMVRQLTVLQIDQTTAVAPSADLIAWSRLGSSYQPAHLRQALEQDRTLFEYDAKVLPVDDLGLYLASMAAWPRREAAREWLRANDRFRRDVLDLLGRRGPLISREIPDTCVVPWRGSSRNVTQMLRFLAMRGEIAISSRRGRQRVWDLAGRVFPADTAVVPLGTAHQIRNERRLRSLGIVRAASADGIGEPAIIEGVDGLWQVDPAAVGQPFTGRTALLSPFDRLVRNRLRVAELFAFTYILEMHVPTARRQWGRFALPILHDDRFVGKVDAVADPKSGTFVVHAIHEDVAFTPAMTEAVHGELQDLASWLRLATAPQDDLPILRP